MNGLYGSVSVEMKGIPPLMWLGFFSSYDISQPRRHDVVDRQISPDFPS